MHLGTITSTGLINTKDGTAGGAGVSLTLATGAGEGVGAGGALALTAGASGGGATGNGGGISLTAGAAASTSGSGGAIDLTPGAGAGAGVAGLIGLNGGTLFPTTAPAPAVSAAGTARIFFNGTLLQLSQNGAAYTSLNGSPTKDAWFPAETSSNFFTTYRARSLSGTGQFNFDFRVPRDFTSIISLVAVCAPNANFGAAGAIDLESNYGADGESVGAHNETQSLTGLSGTQDVWTEIDISGVFTALAAGDYCGVNLDVISGIGTGVNYIGIRLRYN